LTMSAHSGWSGFTTTSSIALCSVAMTESIWCSLAFRRCIGLHDHQRDAIWRVVSCKSNTLLAHVVGAGKTLTMICAGMELRRLGVAGKPCYVVPNHMLEQFAAEFLRAYPGGQHPHGVQGRSARGQTQNPFVQNCHGRLGWCAHYAFVVRADQARRWVHRGFHPEANR
jgi:hypothetical protein